MNNQNLRFRIVTSCIPFYLVVLCILGSSKSLLAQSNTDEIAKIENTVTELYNAMVKKDSSGLQELTMEALTYGHSSGTIENQSEFINGVLNGSFQFASITPVDQKITTSGSIGMVRHIFKGEGTNNGEPAEVNIGCLLIFQKENEWKLVARQAFKL
ncbi:hypothetical protein LCGC14_0854230 [marine sediment metagenome]|uniref:Nuclear transport factor 2 family protein n=2 Tax=root TaxID=1 RepID=A0A831QP13_9FLAO|nr:nuclear transport factor 2 family protein [Pricia antarctica]